MQVTGAKRICRRLAATTGLLLMLAVTTAGAESFGSDGDSASASSSQVPMPADAVGSGVGEVSPMPAAPPLIDAAAVAGDRAAERLRDGDAPVGQGDEVLGFLDQLVTQYFASYN